MIRKEEENLILNERVSIFIFIVVLSLLRFQRLIKSLVQNCDARYEPMRDLQMCNLRVAATSGNEYARGIYAALLGILLSCN